MEAKFENGEKIIDKVSKFKGTILGVAQYWNGCNRYQVQPEISKDGSFREAQWIDEEQLERTGKKKVKASEKTHGGDRPSPTSHML